MSQIADGIRSFVAVLMGDELRAALADVQDRLRASRAAVKWVAPENIHLTLKFLGNIREDQVEPVAEALGRVGRRTRAFAAHVNGAGAFPNPRRPRVVWAGITSGAEELERLAKEVEDEVAPLGFERERRPFRAHLTLGRVKSVVNVSRLAEALREQSETDFGALRVEALHLMRSDLRPSGPVYSELRQVHLEA